MASADPSGSIAISCLPAPRRGIPVIWRISSGKAIFKDIDSLKSGSGYLANGEAVYGTRVDGLLGGADQVQPLRQGGCALLARQRHDCIVTSDLYDLRRLDPAAPIIAI